jgi:hypothetical protein
MERCTRRPSAYVPLNLVFLFLLIFLLTKCFFPVYSSPLAFSLKVYSDAVNILCLFFLTSVRVEIEHFVYVHHYCLLVML